MKLWILFGLAIAMVAALTARHVPSIAIVVSIFCWLMAGYNLTPRGKARRTQQIKDREMLHITPEYYD